MKFENKLLTLTSAFLLLLFFLIPSISRAASINLIADKNFATVSDQVAILVKIDSEGATINAAQGDLKFPPDLLEAIGIDDTGSIFNFWLEGPEVNKQTGEVHFIGGTTSGYSGPSLSVLKVIFKVRGVGDIDITLNNGAVTARDQSGTNVLSAIRGAHIVSLPLTELLKVTAPQTITREAVLSKALPATPVIEIPVYSDSARWYNFITSFTARWTLPGDVTGVATALDKKPATVPSKIEGLFTEKRFNPLDDGIWYLHIRFKNNIGWSETDHYQIAVDTTPPEPFAITINEGLETDNPSPTIRYSTTDRLSGVEKFYIRINGAERVETEQLSYTLPLQPPGKHSVRVTARDAARNNAESSATMNILPIKAPEIIFYSKQVRSKLEPLIVWGHGVPDYSVKVSLVYAQSGAIIQEQTVKVHANRHWFTEFSSALPAGEYRVEATAIDQRGAMSFPISSLTPIKIIEKPFVIIGDLELNFTTFLVTIVIILVVALIIGYISRSVHYARHKRRR